MQKIKTGARRLWGLMFDRLAIGIPAVLLLVAGFVVAYQFVEPAPPDHMVIAAGPEGGAYYRYALAYRDRLAAEGVTLDVRATAGTAENLGLLARGDPDDSSAKDRPDNERRVDVALIQTGVAGPETFPDLRSLGSLYYEPIWVFVRTDRLGSDVVDVGGLKALAGRNVAIGAPGSGSRAVAERLLAATGVRITDVPVDSPAEAARALTSGVADAVVMVASPGTDVLDGLIHAPSVALLAIPEAEAITRHFRDLSVLTIPATMLDLDRGIPDRDTRMLAATANLVVDDDLHPALKELLVLTAMDIHRGADLLHAAGTFPTADHPAFPLGDEATNLYERGPSFLQRYLPFWAANLINRFMIMLLPLLTLVIPLVRVTPPVYRWRVRRRIYLWYRELMKVEQQLFTGSMDRAGVLKRLDHVERETSHVAVPLSYAVELYNLRLHIQYLRGRALDDDIGDGALGNDRNGTEKESVS